ncbi:GIY-YIG nuclease family protein [Aliivibrio wodanis]|uniref:GIY-YIG nuclease family protein n=1 Tax=Aliivibrio wodanis TaxID=80852 RepID=UPI00406CEA6A
MSIYLSFGKDSDGNFHHISDQKSGRTKLYCPFCNSILIAVKGTKKAAHFRHDGDTCNESLTELPTIAGWHHFHLSYPINVIKELNSGYDPKSKSPTVFQNWNIERFYIKGQYQQELLKKDTWSENWLFTDVARIILGSLPLLSFGQWMRNTLQQRIIELKEQISSNHIHTAWLDIEAHRQQSILNASLYLFEYHLEDGTIIHKVGRTQREPKDRLKETIFDLERALQKKIKSSKVLRVVAHAGYIEQYVFHRYQQQKLQIDSHREYLLLDNQSIKNIKSEFTKLINNIEPFNKDERFIATGRWRYEERRLLASKRGIKLTQKEGGKFGRPKGTALKQDAFLEKHADLVALLNNGQLSMSKISDATRKSRSTIKRVKAAMDKS